MKTTRNIAKRKILSKLTPFSPTSRPEIETDIKGEHFRRPVLARTRFLGIRLRVQAKENLLMIFIVR